MIWSLRQHQDGAYLLVGQCDDCLRRTEIWVDSPDTSTLNLEAHGAHVCCHVLPPECEPYKTQIITSYAQVLAEGWGTNLPRHMWFWPSHDTAEHHLISVPWTATDKLEGSPDQIMDKLFQYQLVLGQLMASDTSYEPGMVYMIHVEVLDASTIQVSESYLDSPQWVRGQSTSFTLDDSKLIGSSGEALPRVSTVDGIVSFGLKEAQRVSST